MSTGTVGQQLLSPFDLHGLPLRNRVVMAPMTRSRAGVQRKANPLMATYYAQRASAGLIVTEATVISDQANGWNNSPGIDTAERADSWRQVVDAVHERGSFIFLQLWHCGRASHSSFHADGSLPVAPSAVKHNGDHVHTPNGPKPYETPRALETEEIPAIVADYQRAAERAKGIGFDGVEIHSANGYLIDQFLQSKTNQRTDRYGGSVENRYRFLDEIVDATTEVWPSNRVSVRLSPNGVFNDMGSPDFRETFTYAASQLDKKSLAYLHVLDGLAFGSHGLGEPMTLEELRGVYHGVLMGNCGYDQNVAEKAIASGHADLIAFGRPYLSNPDLVERFANGWPLEPIPSPQTWYSFDPKGYADYPPYQPA